MGLTSPQRRLLKEARTKLSKDERKKKSHWHPDHFCADNCPLYRQNERIDDLLARTSFEWQIDDHLRSKIQKLVNSEKLDGLYKSALEYLNREPDFDWMSGTGVMLGNPLGKKERQALRKDIEEAKKDIELLRDLRASGDQIKRALLRLGTLALKIRWYGASTLEELWLEARRAEKEARRAEK
jgi:hypothetical protein